MNVRGNKGQAAFIGVIMLVMGFFIFFLSLPFLNGFINATAESEGAVIGFFIKLIPWVVLVFMSIGGIRLILFGGGGGE